MMRKLGREVLVIVTGAGWAILGCGEVVIYAEGGCRVSDGRKSFPALRHRAVVLYYFHGRAQRLLAIGPQRRIAARNR